MIRIGQINYANCTPIFHSLKKGFDCANYEFIKGVPSKLNELLLSGELDVSPSSSIEFARHPDQYTFLPDLSISSVGNVGSIILFSNVPLENLDGERIAITSTSATSSVLLRIIMTMFLRMKNTFYEESRELKGVLKDNKAFLLIGDDALRGVQSCKLQVTSENSNSKLKTPNSELYIYDLGELWHKFTKLPFVFALWLVRRESLIKKGKEIMELGKSLLSAKEKAYRDLMGIAEESEEKNWMDMDKLIDYWKKISYDLRDAHLNGLRMFYRYAEELSIIKKAPLLEEGIISPTL